MWLAHGHRTRRGEPGGNLGKVSRIALPPEHTPMELYQWQAQVVGMQPA